MKFQNKQNNMRLPRNRNEWISLISIVAILLVLSSINGLKDTLFGNNNPDITTNAQVAPSIVNQFDGKNFDIFPDLTEIPVEYISSSDGDTVKLKINNFEFRARYLMINTPEIGNDPQPFAKEARSRNHQLLKNAYKITVAFDKGNHSDHYDRALIYIFADGVDVGELLLQEGLASLDYVYPPNNSYESKYKQAESQAQSSHVGIWQ